MKRHIVLLVTALLIPVLTAAQQSATIKGKVMDSATNTVVDYADVFVTDLNDNVVASSMVNNGDFEVTGIKTMDVLLMIRMLGYETYISDKLTLHGGQTLDVGTIQMAESAMGLDEVTVVGERSQIVYKLDRQRINAQQSVTAAGGTAVDVLANTPSVQVDADGELTFRGSSNYLVYVDGKLSPLTGTQALQQIPAGTIENIEIITTPSARYKSEGDVGIINVTTKNIKANGWSGLVNVSGSTLGTNTIDARLNYQHGLHNWWVGGTWQDIKSKSDFRQNKTTIVDDFTTTSSSDGTRFRTQKNMTAQGGWQFADKKHHTASLDFQIGNTKNLRGGDMLYGEHRMQGDDVLVDNSFNSHDRYKLEKELYQLSGDYTWKINDRNNLNARFRTRFDRYSLEYTESNMFDHTGSRYEGTRGYEQEHHGDHDAGLTYNYDYSSTGKLEVGYQYTYYSEHGNYNIKYWNRGAQQFEWQDDLHAPFYYRRETHSGYAQMNDTWGRFSLDAGVRVDRVIDRLEITVANANRHIKRLELYPSAHLSYDMQNAGTLKIGYSRRTNRPGIWQLEPYITYEDYYTKKIGNPDINPEYIHSIELGWSKQWDGGHSANVTGYFRSREDVIDNVRVAYEPGVTLDSIINAGNQVEMGLEMSLVVKPVRWWTSTLNGSVYRYDFDSHFAGSADADGVSGQIGWVNAFTLSKDARLQIDSHVVTPVNLTQGKEYAYCYFDAAYRHNLAKGKLTLSVVAHDILHTAKYHNYRSTPTLLSETWVRPKYPNIVASVSFNFNAFGGKTTSVSSGSLFEGKDF